MTTKQLSLRGILLSLFSSGLASAANLKVGDAAPLFTSKTHDGKDFDLAQRRGQWTVLYFYPKAETPGCTKQACAFRDSIKVIRSEGAEVFGVSSDDVKAQADFHAHHHLNFALIADAESKVLGLYGTKMPLLRFSKRWTFVIDPELKIRAVDKDVDPAKDAARVAETIRSLKKSGASPAARK